MLLGVCGMIGVDDLLCCFVAGCFMNWDGEYQAETVARHDEVNVSVDFMLNLLYFFYIGAIMPWSDFHDPEGHRSGLTIGPLIGLSVLVLLLRRIPAIFLFYKFLPDIQSWKEALFAG